LIERFEIRTHQQQQLIDITPQVQQWLTRTAIRQGTLLIFIPHTTAAVTINENADPDVVTDMLKDFDRLIPDSPNFRHSEGNSAAHIKSSLVGVSQSLIIDQGAMLLGPWQSLYFCEFDGPRSRTFYASITPGQSP
jgi:secondary thiamine-phosphate synthase enzyme